MEIPEYVENIAIKFAEWLKEEEYYMRSNGKGEWFDLSGDFNKKADIYTTKELYNKFLIEEYGEHYIS